MTDIPLLQKKAYDHRDLWVQQKKIVPVIDDVLERRLKSQSLISNTLVATLAESLQDAIKTDTLNITQIVNKVGTLLQSDHHKSMQMISTIMSRGKELASSLSNIEGSASQVLILFVLLGVIILLLLINICVTYCARNTLINKIEAL